MTDDQRCKTYDFHVVANDDAEHVMDAVHGALSDAIAYVHMAIGYRKLPAGVIRVDILLRGERHATVWTHDWSIDLADK